MIRENQIFFEVMFHDDIWKELKKHMYPNKDKSNIYNYKNGDIAAYYGYLSLIKQNPNLIFTNNCLINASYRGHLEVVQYLVENKDRLKIEIDDFAIFTSANRGHLEILKYLHTAKDVSCYCDDELSIIDFVVLENLEQCFDTIIFLCENNAPRGTRRAIDWAAKNGRLDIIRYLRKQNYRCTTNALDYAASNGHIDVVKYLIAKGLVGTNNRMKRSKKFAKANKHYVIANILSHEIRSS